MASLLLLHTRIAATLLFCLLLSLPSARLTAQASPARNIGAGTLTAPLGSGTVLFQCMPPMHPAMRARWLANALGFLAATSPKGVH